MPMRMASPYSLSLSLSLSGICECVCVSLSLLPLVWCFLRAQRDTIRLLPDCPQIPSPLHEIQLSKPKDAISLTKSCATSVSLRNVQQSKTAISTCDKCKVQALHAGQDQAASHSPSMSCTVSYPRRRTVPP